MSNLSLPPPNAITRGDAGGCKYHDFLAEAQNLHVTVRIFLNSLLGGDILYVR